MLGDSERGGAGSRFLLTAACLVVVVAGLRAAAGLMLPVLAAGFLSILCIPPMRRLQARGLPAWLSIVVVVTLATGAVVVVTTIIGNSISQFQDSLPLYDKRLNAMLAEAVGWLNGHGIKINLKHVSEIFHTDWLMQLVGSTAAGLLSALSNVILVALTMLFMLVEANDLPAKLRLALHNPDADLSDFRRAVVRVQRYLLIKAAVSLLIGVLVAVLIAVTGVDFPLLWGLVAFLFNFVPNIGALIGAIPAVLLALIQCGPATAGIVSLGFLVIHMVIGNGLEPKLMGRGLGLSTLVVFLSMVFWGWVWGPMGMLLSVPLTVIVKIVLEHSDDMRWLAVLLGPGGEDVPPASRRADAAAAKTPPS